MSEVPSNKRPMRAREIITLIVLAAVVIAAGAISIYHVRTTFSRAAIIEQSLADQGLKNPDYVGVGDDGSAVIYFDCLDQARCSASYSNVDSIPIGIYNFSRDPYDEARALLVQLADPSKMKSATITRTVVFNH